MKIPKLVNGRGTIPIDRSFGVVDGVEIGKLRRPSGTTDEAEYVEIMHMLDKFASGAYENGAKLLLAIKRGDKSIQEIKAAFDKGKTAKVNFTPTKKLLQTEVWAWLDKGLKRNALPYSPETLRAYRNNFNQLFKHCTEKTPLVDLPKVLNKYRAWCVEEIDPETKQRREYYAPYNQTITAVQAFIVATQEDRQFSDLYRDVRKLLPVAHVVKGERQGRPLWEIREIMAKMTHREAHITWILAMTGMRFPSEYKTDWTVADGVVTIPGEKTEYSDRYVPDLTGLLNLYPIEKVTLAESTFRKKLRKAAESLNDSIDPYELRYTYQHLLERSGIDESRQRFYFGHTESIPQKDRVRAKYQTHDYMKYLKEDTAALMKAAKGMLENPKKKKKSA